MLRKLLRREGYEVGRKHVATLMRKKNASKRHPEHARYPYLLRGVAIERPNQVWALDITYIPMRRGFVYFCAVIVNTDQGSQFTGSEFIDALNRRNIAISMDGKGCWRDNVFIERFWKTLKYDEVYLSAYDTVSEARESIKGYVAFYDSRPPHSSIEDRMPNEAYFGMQALTTAA